MTITVALTPGGAAALQRLRTMSERLPSALKSGIDAALEEGMQQTLKARFTGRGPFPPAQSRLGIRSGLLRTSFRRTPTVEHGGVYTASIGSNAKYWLVHEFGSKGPVAVDAHTRRTATTSKGERISLRRAAASRAKVKPTISTHSVRAHTRQMNMPERKPMRTGLEERAARMGQVISSHLIRAAK